MTRWDAVGLRVHGHDYARSSRPYADSGCRARRRSGQQRPWMYDDNGNGRIACAEARNQGIAPVRREYPGYGYMNDADNDGAVCE